MGKLWWVSRVGLPIAALMAIALYISQPGDQTNLVSGLILIGVIVLAGASLWVSIMELYFRSTRKREPEPASYIPVYPSHATEKIPNYCKDCGSQIETTRWVKGYDPETGKKVYGSTRRCPNREKVRMAMASAGTPMFNLGPHCGDPWHKHSSGAVSRHTHANEWKTDITCNACIDQMLGDGIINDSQASDLRRRAGS